MQIEMEQLWDLHDYLIDRSFVLYDEDDDETYTRWQHEPSGSVIRIDNTITMTEALTVGSTAHALHVRYQT
jgi:hypothetical protein